MCTHSSPQIQLMQKYNKSGKKQPKRPSGKDNRGKAKRQLVVREQDESHVDRHDNVSSGSLSDNEGFSDSDRDVMNNLIDGSDDENSEVEFANNSDREDNASVGPNDTSTQGEELSQIGDSHRPLSPTSISAKADDIFCRDYVVDPPLLHLHPVSETLAATFTEWCRVTPKKDEIKDMFKKALIPINVEGLYPVRINEPVFRKLPLKAKIQDQHLRGLNTFLARGTGPVLSIFNDLCQMEAAISSSSASTNISINDSKQLMIDGMTIDFKDMRVKLGHALRLLSTAHSVLLQRRRASLRPYLDFKFQYLTRESNPVTTLLLGGDLELKVTEAVKTSEVAKKLTYARTPRR